MHDTANYGTSFTTRGNPTIVTPLGDFATLIWPTFDTLIWPRVRKQSAGSVARHSGFAFQRVNPPQPPGTVQLLSQVKRMPTGICSPCLTHTIEYNNSVEPTKLTLPYGAYFRYTYATAAFSNGAVERREVQNRFVNDKATGQTPVEKLYAFSHQGNDRPRHSIE